MPKPKILIIEDERSLVEVLTYNLEREGYEVFVANDGQEGLRQAQLKLPDLIVLDLMLPVKPGLEVCRELRNGARTREIPIIMVTAKAEETDELVGFAVGADDYVTKPYSMKVLIERIKKELRRRQVQEEQPAGTLIESQGVVIDRHSHRALYRDEELPLTPTEFRLLEVLLRQPGRAFTRFELMDAAIGEDAVVLERTIDVHIKSLRKKLGDATGLIETVRGVGYRFHEPRLVVEALGSRVRCRSGAPGPGALGRRHHGARSRHELGPDHRDLPRRVDSEPDLSSFQPDDRDTDVIADKEFFHQFPGQHQHGTVPQGPAISVLTLAPTRYHDSRLGNPCGLLRESRSCLSGEPKGAFFRPFQAAGPVPLNCGRPR